MSKITVIDFLSKDSSHLSFNTTLLQALEQNKSSYTFFGKSSHITQLQTNLNGDFNSINDSKGNWKTLAIKVFLKVLFANNKKILLAAFENYISLTLFIVFFPFFLNKKFILIMHNNIGALKGSVIKRIPFKVFNFLFKVKIICNTQKGLTTMNELGVKNAHLVPHANFMHLGQQSFEIDLNLNSGKLNVFLVGRQAKYFIKYQLDKLDFNTFKNIHFYLFSKEKIAGEYPGVFQVPKRVSSEEYNYIFQNFDYCLLQDFDSIFRASGILMDCISHSCPIIAPKTGHFSEVINYNLGYHYENLNATLKLLSEEGFKRNEFPSERFLEIQEKTSLANFAVKLNDIVEA